MRARYGAGPLATRARAQIAHELRIIGRLDLAGYFLIVWDIVEHCRANDILVQGRGSAANSAVCYALGITAVDPVSMELLFERFLSEARGEWPDIDLDLPSGERREAVIQYVYRRYGRLGAGMTANVITYRGRSAAREVGKALGLPRDMQDRLARLVANWGYQDPDELLIKHLAEAGCDPSHPRIRHFARLWLRIQDLPRHLGQHSGGMVIAAGRLDDVVPLEPATMPGRVVVQWDKDDCAGLGIIKIDLLGLGMMAVLQEAITLVSETGGSVDLGHLPPDDSAVYRSLQRADTIGVFQVESRAQMATLPRILPERFYDLVVQVAIIRPGPIVGEMVHPYIRRRRGRDADTGRWVPIEDAVQGRVRLESTLACDAEMKIRKRRVLKATASGRRMVYRVRTALGREITATAEHPLLTPNGWCPLAGLRLGNHVAALRSRGAVPGEGADLDWERVASIEPVGERETYDLGVEGDHNFLANDLVVHNSHASSFALLAYASAYLKVHHPAAFYAALLNNQPMGFYHPATIVKDAQRHGLRFLPIDVTRSQWLCTIELGTWPSTPGWASRASPRPCPA